MCYYNAHVDGLRVPLMALIDYRGACYSLSSYLPIFLSSYGPFTFCSHVRAEMLVITPIS